MKEKKREGREPAVTLKDNKARLSLKLKKKKIQDADKPDCKNVLKKRFFILSRGFL